MYTCIYIYIHACMNIPISIYIYIYTYIDIEHTYRKNDIPSSSPSVPKAPVQPPLPRVPRLPKRRHRGLSRPRPRRLRLELQWGYHWGSCGYFLIGGFNPSEKYESIGMMTFPLYGKIKNVPNH